MRTFNIELAAKGHPVCTRDGRKVTILTTEMLSGTPIVGIIHYSEKIQDVYGFYPDGSFMGEEEHHNDLFMTED